MPISMNHPLFPSEDGSLLENDNVMGHMTHTTQQVHKVAGLFSHQLMLEKSQYIVFLSYGLLSEL